jgi:alpha-ketoglutarate-dependent taurine dioxygenase
LIHLEAGKVVFSFSRRPLLGSVTSPRSRNIPDLNDRQVEALNMVQLLAEENALVLDLEAGDMLFWNNLGLLHARNGFY